MTFTEQCGQRSPRAVSLPFGNQILRLVGSQGYILYGQAEATAARLIEVQSSKIARLRSASAPVQQTHCGVEGASSRVLGSQVALLQPPLSC